MIGSYQFHHLYSNLHHRHHQQNVLPEKNMETFLFIIISIRYQDLQVYERLFSGNITIFCNKLDVYLAVSQ